MKIFEIFRSLSFGALFVGGLLGLVFLLFPDLFPNNTGIDNVIAIGGLIGGGAHGIINRWFNNSFMRGLGRRIDLYSKIFEIKALECTDQINISLARQLSQWLITVHVIDDKETLLELLQPSAKELQGNSKQRKSEGYRNQLANLQQELQQMKNELAGDTENLQEGYDDIDDLAILSSRDS